MVQISVVIPSYKPGTYIYKCLDSLRTQTLFLSEFEVIVVLNASDEKHEQMLRAYITKENLTNMRVLVTSTPGVSNARNMALDVAEGEYVYFLDDDDYISPNSLENLLKRSDGKSLIVSNFRTFVSDEDTSFGKDYVSRAFATTKKNDLVTRRSFLSSCCGKLISRNMIGTHRFNDKLKNSEDALFMFSISDRIVSIELAPEDTYYYRRVREASASRKSIPLAKRMQMLGRLLGAFSAVYWSAPFRYSFMLYLTRVCAVIIYYLKRK
jgi:glycosyltransferase involved in cell wall biosynthesis